MKISGRLNHSPLQSIQKSLQKSVCDLFGLPLESPGDFSFEVPPITIQADLTIPMFGIAKRLTQNPAQLATALAAFIGQQHIPLVSHVHAVGPYVNVSFQAEYYDKILRYILATGEDFGRSKISKKKKVLLSFSTAIARPLHINQIRPLLIGQVLAQILDYNGHTTASHNYVADWNATSGELLYAFKEWSGGTLPPKGKALKKTNKLYTLFLDHSLKHEGIKAKAKLLFQKLAQKDPVLLQWWHDFMKILLRDLAKRYELDGFRFDTYIAESSFLKKSDATLNRVAKAFGESLTEQGVMVINENTSTPAILVRKQDGSHLSIIRTLANLDYQIRKVKPARVLYIIKDDEEISFHQLKTLAEKAGYLPAHIATQALVTASLLADNRPPEANETQSLDDALFHATAHARERIIHNNPSLSEREIKKLSTQVGQGSLFYYILRHSPTRALVLDWKKIFSFEDNDTAAYLQYTYARIYSLLKKVKANPKMKKSYTNERPEEAALAKLLARFPVIVEEAARDVAPHLICMYLEEVAQRFNGFYGTVSVQDTVDMHLQKSRLALMQATAIVIKNGLKILYIDVPRKI